MVIVYQKKKKIKMYNAVGNGKFNILAIAIILSSFISSYLVLHAFAYRYEYCAIIKGLASSPWRPIPSFSILHSGDGQLWEDEAILI